MSPVLLQGSPEASTCHSLGDVTGGLSQFLSQFSVAEEEEEEEDKDEDEEDEGDKDEEEEEDDEDEDEEKECAAERGCPGHPQRDRAGQLLLPGMAAGVKLELQPGLPRAVLQSSSCSPQGSWPAQGMCHLPGAALSLPGSSPWMVQGSCGGKEAEQMSNSSSISHFLLLALADTRQLQLLHFCLLLGISLAALLGNGLIISAVACGHHLHTPMFFFLLNLALSDLGSICTTVPKAMHNSLWDTRNISYKGCAAQVFLFVFFISAEVTILTIMCYDRYVSICKPLHYGTLLGSRACAHMAAAAWASGFLNALLHTANTFSLPLCHGNALGQFFCEIPQILKLSCSKSYLREVWFLVFSMSFVFGCFVFMVFSYVQIFRAVLRMPL
ncbi:unnamed protein product [Coccothraustes coccothraustes]